MLSHIENYPQNYICQAINRLLPIKYFQNIAVYTNDLGFFSIVDSISISTLDSLVNSPIIKTRAAYYLSRAFQSLGRTEEAMKILVAAGAKSADDIFSKQGYEWALKQKGEWLDAETFFVKGDNAKARKLFDEALEETPSLKERYGLLTAFYGVIGKTDSAFIWAKMGSFFTPKNPIIPYNMGVLFARKGEPDSSEYYFHKTLSIAPDYASAITNLGVLFLNAGKCDSAIYYFNRATEIDTTNWTYFQNLLGGLQQCGKNKELIEKIDYAIKHFSDKADVNMLKKLKNQTESQL